MCKVDHYVSLSCDDDVRHEWIKLLAPCNKDMDLETCPMFQHATLQPVTPRPKTKHARDQCPKCNLEGEYKCTEIRMIDTLERGVITSKRRAGRNGARKEPVVVCYCVLM